MTFQFDPTAGDLVKVIQLNRIQTLRQEGRFGRRCHPPSAGTRRGSDDDSPDGARATSTALAWMTERYFYRAFKHGTSLGDAAQKGAAKLLSPAH